MDYVAIDRVRIAELIWRERAAYAARFPRSKAAFAAASAASGGHLLGGVPMTWMRCGRAGSPSITRPRPARG